MTKIFHKTRLPDQITLENGPVRLLAQFLLQADRAAFDRGVRLSLQQDFELLRQVNEQSRTSWGKLVPIFNPEHSDLTPANSFWIAGCDAAGEIVATQAARFLPLEASSLAAELASLRLFYREPGPHRDAGERCEVLAPSAAAIAGRVVFSGGGWYHPRCRGTGLSSILPRISRAYAHSRWATDYTVSMVEPVLTEKGVVRSYGYSKVEPMIRFLGSFRGDLDLHLIWMATEEMLQDLTAWAVRERTAGTVQDRTAWATAGSSEYEDRRIEAPQTNSSPRDRHGSIKRS
jgi:hypothetical protein